VAKIIGILKLIASFGGIVILIMTFFNLETKDVAEKIISIAIIFLIGGIYIYYLVLTGIWNLNDRTYKSNILLYIGVAIHFIFILTLIYFSYTSAPRNVFLTSLFASIFAIAIGVFDVKHLILGWKNRKSALSEP
jgi:hypothetical protein